MKFVEEENEEIAAVADDSCSQPKYRWNISVGAVATYGWYNDQVGETVMTAPVSTAAPTQPANTIFTSLIGWECSMF